jgi:hypothetical protein
MQRRGYVKALVGLVALFAMAASGAAMAANLPDDNEQEILVKTTLMTFNDANLTGNYTVLHDKAATPFRKQLLPDKLADTFKDFRDKKVNIESIVADDIAPGSEAQIDNGVLTLKGRFKDDTRRIRFDLKFIREDNAWKLVGLNVNYKE